jgi:serine protease inhibitor
MGECTYSDTGRSYSEQMVGQCFDCFEERNHAICINCLNKCHRGHHITNIRLMNAFCDCAESGECKCAINTSKNVIWGVDGKLRNAFGKICNDVKFVGIHEKHELPIPQLSPCMRGNGNGSKNNGAISKAVMNFGVNVVNKNDLTISPYSIITALILAQYGAVGETLDEFKNVLLTDKQENLDEAISIYETINKSGCCKTCNIIMSRTPLIEKYTSSIKSLAKITGMNVDETNSFVAKFTNNLISTAISPDVVNDPFLRVILLNVVYFKSQWKSKFDVRSTKIDTFYGLSNEKQISFMNKYNYNFRYYRDGVNQFLEMDYVNSDFTFGMILPRSKSMRPKVTNELIFGYIHNSYETEINHLTMPKFTFKNNFNLNDILKGFGLKKMFDENRNEFTDMATIQLYVSKVIHEIVVIVDEEGTEATACTSIFANTLGCDSETRTINFIADHPFLYYIRYKPLNLILFNGIYV